jgi:predicted transcriptional regulator
MLSVNSGISRLQIVENTMPTAKEAMVNIIARQPDDSSYDEILRELAFAQMVERGLADSDAGRTLTDSEVRTRIDSWQK